MSIKPSDLHKAETFSRIPVDALQRYLLSRGWRRVFTEDDREIVWFYHDRLPVIKINYRMSTWPEGYMSAHMVPREIDVPDREWLVKTIPQHFGDYVHAVFDLLEDLERHEDRWQGAILDDILALADTPADKPETSSPDESVQAKRVSMEMTE